MPLALLPTMPLALLRAAVFFQEETEPVDPQIVVDRVVLALLMLAALLALLTVLFVWHTQPHRRAAAEERKANNP